MTVSLQLYSMRDVADQIALLSKLPSMGITRVEGYGGVYGDPKVYRAAMDANGITMPSGHMGLNDIEEDFDATMDIVRTMGITRVYAPYLEEKDRPTTTAGYVDLAKRLNAASLRYAEHGISFGWHNHDFEFFALPDGSIPMEILLETALDIRWKETSRGSCAALVIRWTISPATAAASPPFTSKISPQDRKTRKTDIQSSNMNVSFVRRADIWHPIAKARPCP